MKFIIKTSTNFIIIDHGYNSKLLDELAEGSIDEEIIVPLNDQFNDGLQYLNDTWLNPSQINLNSLSLKNISDYIQIVDFFRFPDEIIDTIINQIVNDITNIQLDKLAKMGTLNLNQFLIEKIESKLSDYDKLKLFNRYVYNHQSLWLFIINIFNFRYFIK